MILRNVLSRFTRHLQAQGCSIHTVRSYACDLRKLGQFLGGNVPVSRIRPDDLSRFLTSNKALLSDDGTPKSPGAVNRMRAVLRSFFRWLVETGQLRTNAASTLRVRVYRPPVPRMLTEKEQETLLATMHASDDPLTLRDLTLVELMLGTGIRLAEVVALDLADVDLVLGRIAIRPKGGGQDARYLTKHLRRLLRKYIAWRAERNETCGALFVSNHGSRISTRHVHRRLKQWLRKAGIDRPISPHALRHTLAVRLLSHTGNLRLVQRALGHASIVSTIRYAQLPDKALVAALEGV